jgi:hypothetical protein
MAVPTDVAKRGNGVINLWSTFTLTRGVVKTPNQAVNQFLPSAGVRSRPPAAFRNARAINPG